MQTLEQLLSGELKGSKQIKLSCGLKEFPNEILDLYKTLEILDLSGNHLSSLPDDFDRLQNLRIAFFSDNDFTEFPQVLSRCSKLDMIGFKANKISHFFENSLPTNLRWLILTNNRLTSVPRSLGKCLKLQKFMLAGNQLADLPKEMEACKNLQLLRISANCFEKLPSWLFSLPQLSWIAFAGIPCSSLGDSNYDLEEIPWNEFSIEEQLGEGASGVISKADWKRGGVDNKKVAVKVFKGEVTSDGLPLDEMNACIFAGHHKNIVKVLGKISHHPNQKKGLVLELIPSSFKNLGGPPSFETCTRDTFPENVVFTLKQIVKITEGIASAAAHLHALGILHGDLYAHNILINENSHPLFGDFGAATLYTKEENALAIERIEVRAFGCLLEDLLDRIFPNDKKEVSFQILNKIKNDCFKDDVLARPDFKTIYEQLIKINIE